MNGIMEIRRQVRLSQWSAMVREREESGLSVKAYCEQTGIAAKTYYYRNRSTTTPSPKTQALGKHRGLDYT